MSGLGSLPAAPWPLSTTGALVGALFAVLVFPWLTWFAVQAARRPVRRLRLGWRLLAVEGSFVSEVGLTVCCLFRYRAAAASLGPPSWRTILPFCLVSPEPYAVILLIVLGLTLAFDLSRDRDVASYQWRWPWRGRREG